MRLLLLLLLATVVRAGDDLATTIRAGDDLATTVKAGDELTHCNELEKALNDNTGLRDIFVQGRPVPLKVFWDGHAPARAAAALLRALLARGMRYRGVSLNRTEEYRLTDAVFSNNSVYDLYNDQLVWPAAAQRPAAGAGSERCQADRLCALRAAAMGPGAAPAAVTLLKHLATEVADEPECNESNSWVFFRNESAVRRCRFATDSGAATVFYLSEYGSVADELTRRARHYGLRWRLVPLGRDDAPRLQLLQLLRAGNQSFLFVDHEVWSTSSRVSFSQPPPCISTPCATSLDPVYTLRLATAVGLNQFLPNVLDVFRKFSPTQQEIREILELEAEFEVENPEEAACAWSSKNIERFKSWFEEDMETTYWIMIFFCTSDPDYEDYRHVLQQVINTTDLKFSFELHTLRVNCSDDYQMSNEASDRLTYRNSGELIGLVGVGEAANTMSKLADEKETAVVLYDSVADEKSLGESTRVMGGPISQLASAIAWFLESCEWARLAVISDRTSLAKGIYEELRNTSLVLRNRELLSYNDAEFKLYLESFREVDARIFYLNTDADTAARVLCAAMDLKMTFDEGYVWLVREWRARNRTCGSAEARAAMRHYTVSFWWRGQDTDLEVDSAGVNFNLTEKLRCLRRGAAWPMLAAPLADALLLLLRAADAFLARHPARAHDLHGRGAARVFWSSMNDTVPGIARGLRACKACVSPRVYVDEWRDGARPRSLAVWPDTGGGRVRAVCGGRTDGGKRCVTTRWYSPHESFVWRCHDWAFLLTALALALAAPALLAARRARLQRLRRRERMLKARLLARSRRAADALAGHLVSRAELELRRELGAGRFGRVRLAVLRAPGRAPQVVAAKALPDDATASEEGEFLKEACTLASLEHEHIVRLVGVCATDGPPLVLMEYAFFGDLSAYLRERRHLAERIDEANEEAEHVSAANLTRLASEAASALAYLATKRLVHRDVRAANCLVDARRALKLADFGLARQTAGGAEYACARRGLFPVLWMAPESLDRGVFSAASDVWALGVLMFELVTLGERPYGDWNPLKVFRYVVGGGRPPLPPDASIKTIGILTSCWRRAPEQRPRAGALCVYLRARRGVLAPALRPAPPPADPAAPATPPQTPTRLSLYTFTQ